MSRHYLLDGYNLLHSTDRWADLPRASQRETFLRYLEEKKFSGSARNTLTVVLDGYSADLKKLRLSSVRLVFSEEVDADTAIKRQVAEMAHPQDAVVVTNDRALQNAVRGLGAQVMACEEFLQLGRKRRALKLLEKTVPPLADAINSELKRLWKLD